MMKVQWDAIVIGAGPAGLAAASTIAENGFDVLVLDEQRSPGGQIYKNIENQPEQISSILGKDYLYGRKLVQRFRDCGASYLPQSVVWKVEKDGKVCYSRNGQSLEIQGKRIVIAIGAMERPQPFEGWTLPGVMGAGAADSFLKGDGMVPTGPVVMAGSGPIMLVVANHMKRLGVDVTHFFDTTSSGVLGKSLPHLPAALKRAPYLAKGVGILASAYLSVGSYHRNVQSIKAEGKDALETVYIKTGRKEKIINTSTLLVHEGIIPRTEFSRQLSLKHDWDNVQRCWYPNLDENGRSGAKNIFISGDGAFVHGAVAAELKGALSGIAVSTDLGADPYRMARTRLQIQRALKHELSPRPFIDNMYPASHKLSEIADSIQVCRCEEVKAGRIRELVRAGQTTPEMVKAVSRVGMGPCQGRMCSCAVSEIIASETGSDIAGSTPHNIRPPVRNIGLGELANMKLLPQNLLEEARS